jgi:RNA polymerase sigma-70 factor (ECF subfamily)
MSAIHPLEVDDTRLAHAVAAGDRAAFEELYRLYAGRLASYGGRVAGDPAAGEDVAQVALLNAYEALRRGTRPRHVRAWLYRIAHNAALEARRRRPACAELDEQNEPGAGDESAELRAALVDALGDLPELQRAAYLLREVQGLRVAEIGAVLELTIEQVEQALFAARNRLAEQLTFGQRLDCDAVRELRADALDLTARRALKSHLRSCQSCRSSAGRARNAGLGALDPLSLLREAVVWLVGGGGMPVVAKLGAVAAAVTVAAGAPVVARHAGDRARPVAPAPVEPPAPPAPPAVDHPSLRLRPASHVERRPRPAPPERPATPPADVRRASAPAALVPEPLHPSPKPVPEAAPPVDEPEAAPEPAEPAPPAAAEEPLHEEPSLDDPPPAADEPAPQPEPEPMPAVVRAEEEPEARVEQVAEARPEPEAQPEPLAAVAIESKPVPAADASSEAPRKSDLSSADQDPAEEPTLSR